MTEPATGLPVGRPIHQFTRRGRVAIDPDEAIYEADIILRGDGGEPELWNGFIACPLFDKVQAQAIAEHVNRIPIDIENPRFVWVGDDLVQYEWDGAPFGVPFEGRDEANFHRSVISPDHLGRYAIGAWNWTWVEIEPLPPRARAEADLA